MLPKRIIRVHCDLHLTSPSKAFSSPLLQLNMPARIAGLPCLPLASANCERVGSLTRLISNVMQIPVWPFTCQEWLTTNSLNPLTSHGHYVQSRRTPFSLHQVRPVKQIFCGESCTGMTMARHFLDERLKDGHADNGTLSEAEQPACQPLTVAHCYSSSLKPPRLAATFLSLDSSLDLLDVPVELYCCTATTALTLLETVASAYLGTVAPGTQ